MSLKVNKIVSSSYLDNNSTALVKAGANVTVTTSASGDYTVGTTIPAGNEIIALTVTTTASAIAVINLTSYAFANAPVVTLTTINSSATQTNIANITSVSSTNLTIRTFVTQSTPVSLLGVTVNPVAVSPNVVVHVHLARV